jgi:uncharacterized membrane protein (DUF106 family)
MAARYLSITKSNLGENPHRTRTINRSFATGPVTLGIFVVLLIASLGIVYLVESNSMTTSGYQIQDLQDKVTELQKSNDELKLEAAELQSLKHLEQVEKDLNMVPNSQTSYVHTDTNIAMR